MNLKDLEWNAGLLAGNNVLSPELIEAAKQMRDIVATLRTVYELDPRTNIKDLPEIIRNAAEPTVVVHVSGGVMTNVTADRPARVLTIDYDTDGSDDSVKDPEGDDCVIGDGTADVDPAYVEKIAKLA